MRIIRIEFNVDLAFNEYPKLPKNFFGYFNFTRSIIDTRTNSNQALLSNSLDGSTELASLFKIIVPSTRRQYPLLVLSQFVSKTLKKMAKGKKRNPKTFVAPQ